MASATATAEAVRALYERLPYPPPPADLDAYRDDRVAVEGSPRHYGAMYWPDRAPAAPDTLDVLVAGCGTAQAAKLAVQNPRARVVGIDLCERSLDVTRGLAERYDLDRLELHRLPLERVADLDRTFDLIVSTGVLHHLPDPDAGLGALADVLRPDGALHAMVYATYGRAGLAMMQEYARRLGVSTDPGDLRDLHGVASVLAPEHPLRMFTRAANDLAHAEGVADALLHPCERAYTVPEVHDWIDLAGLRHVRWFLQAPYDAACGLPANTPHAVRLAKLPVREQHAAVELLRGTMITHTFVACRPERAAAYAAVDPRGDGWRDRWRDLVPHRFAGATVRRDGLAPGVVAALRHAQHAAPDLALPLGPVEAALYAAIDGVRPLGAIVDAVAVPGATAAVEAFARAFFARLWRHDQVLFTSA